MLAPRAITMTLSALPRRVWDFIRAMTGDDAYEIYLDHWRAEHAADQTKPLTRREFHKRSIAERWNGVRRCC